MTSVSRRPTVLSFASLGAVLLIVAWVLVPYALQPLGLLPPFTAHMTMHMLVVAVAAPAFAIAIAISPRDPVASHPLRWSVLVASMVELIVVWAWHAPASHALARAHVWARVIEQGSFLCAGVYLWLAALGGGAELRRERAIGGVTGLLLTSMHMTLLGALLTFGQRLLFVHGRHGDHEPLLLSPLHDQQLGGAVMLVVGGAVYLTGGLAVAADALRGAPRDVAMGDGMAPDDRPPFPAEPNAASAQPLASPVPTTEASS